MKTRPQPARQRRHATQLQTFNPTLPVDDSLVVAGELRDQFNGLAALIDAVDTLPSWEPAAVTTSVSGNTPSSDSSFFRPKRPS